MALMCDGHGHGHGAWEMGPYGVPYGGVPRGAGGLSLKLHYGIRTA